MKQLLGINVSDGPKWKHSLYNPRIGTETYTRKLPDGRKEVIMKAYSDMKPVHFFTEPEIKVESKAIKFIKNCLKCFKK